jgi:hypothetical protein
MGGYHRPIGDITFLQSTIFLQANLRGLKTARQKKMDTYKWTYKALTTVKYTRVCNRILLHLSMETHRKSVELEHTLCYNCIFRTTPMCTSSSIWGCDGATGTGFAGARWQRPAAQGCGRETRSSTAAPATESRGGYGLRGCLLPPRIATLKVRLARVP